MLIKIAAAVTATLALSTLVFLIARRAPSVIHAKRTFHAPAEQVWTAMTSPDKVRGWWTAPPWQTTKLENDLRVGGRFLLCAKNADEVICQTGVYDDVNPGHALSATVSFCDEDGHPIPGRLAPAPGHWPDQWRLEVVFETRADATRVDVWQRGVPMIEKFQTKWRWRQRLAKLDTLL